MEGKIYTQNQVKLIKEWAKLNLVGNSYSSPIGDINITMRGVKETLNQPHKLKHGKNNAIYTLPILLENSKHVRNAIDIKGKGTVKEYHYLEIFIGIMESYIVIKETWEGSMHFYSIVDRLK